MKFNRITTTPAALLFLIFPVFCAFSFTETAQIGPDSSDISAGHAVTDTLAVFHDTISQDSVSSLDTSSMPASVPSPSINSNTLQKKADSLSRAAKRDSLTLLKKSAAGILTSYPVSPDSFFNPNNIYQFQIFSCDAGSPVEILKKHPLVVPVSFSLQSGLNRIMLFGIPSQPVSLQPADGGSIRIPSAFSGTDMTGASQIHNASFALPGTVKYTCLSPSLVFPEIRIQWENGVFDGNALDVRFARPLGRNMDIAAFSNYKYLKRMNYKHTSGGIYDFYSGIINDTTLIMRNERNPLTMEQTTAARIGWKSNMGANGGFLYSYSDIHNDIAKFYIIDTSGIGATAWMESSLYLHNISAWLNGINAGIFRLKAAANLKNEVIRTGPSNDSSNVVPYSRGESFLRNLSVSPFLPAGRDTTSLTYEITSDDRIRFSGHKWDCRQNSAAISHTHAMTLGVFDFSLNGAIGLKTASLSDSLELALSWNLDLKAAAGRNSAGIFAKQDIMPVEVPYDTMLIVTPGAFIDRYRIYGARTFLSLPLAGIDISAAFTDNIDSYKARYYWPGGILPYSTPGRVVTVAPVLGRWRGLAASSAWMFSDVKPYIKSYSTLSWISPGLSNRQRLFFDAGFTYWSERDIPPMGGISTWGRPIYNLHCKTSVQIRTFRLYYRMDNMLNRKTAWVPGYFLPGLTFRWGFNWFLQA
jgi:hypothetical protein